MNRDILFRAKCFGNWRYGSYVHFDKKPINSRCNINYKDFIITNEDDGEGYYPITDLSSIGQYTGLKDKNGTKIFEGDILRLTIPDGSTRHFVVEWANEDRTLKPLNDFQHDGNPIRISAWCFNWNGHRLYPTVMDGVPDNERMTIVGNIHDNPRTAERRYKMRKIFTMCTSIEEADEIGHFIMSKGYEGVQNDSYRYCRESMDFYLKRNRAVHNRNFVFVGANRDSMIVSYCKKVMKKRGLKYIEKPRVFKELLEENEYVQKINMRRK